MRKKRDNKIYPERVGKRKRMGPHRGYSMFTCSHTWRDDDGEERHSLATIVDGVFCQDCGFMLTWLEIAEYMRGEKWGAEEEV